MPATERGGPPFFITSALAKTHQSCLEGPKEFSFKAGSISKIILTGYSLSRRSPSLFSLLVDEMAILADLFMARSLII